MDKKRLLVIKDSGKFANPEMGLVRPVAYQIDGEYLPIPEEDFPNGGVFISKNYLEIDQKYELNNIFILTDYFDTTEDDWRENKKLQKHFSLGSKTEELDRNSLMPIIETMMPSKSEGICEENIEFPNQPFFIKESLFLYGPFQAKRIDGHWALSPVTTPTHLNLPQEYIGKFSIDVLSEQNIIQKLNIFGDEKLFISNFKLLNMNDAVGQEDYISDSRLINFFTKNGFGKSAKNILGKAEATKLSNGIDDFLRKNRNISGNNDRLERLRSLLEGFIEHASYGQEIVQEFLTDTVEGKKYLDHHFKTNKEFLLKDKIDEIRLQAEDHEKQLDQKLNRLRAEILSAQVVLEEEKNKVNQARQEAERKIKDIQEQSKQEAHRELSTKQEELTSEIINLEKNKDELASQIKELENKLEMSGHIFDFKEEIKFLKREKDAIEREGSVAKRAVEAQKALLSSPSLTDKLVEINTLRDLLSNQNNASVKPAIVVVDEISKSTVALTTSNKKDYINYLISQFQNMQGKQFTFDEMANLVISSVQSFLTILSGPPGVGKTSSVLRLAKAMSLVGESGPRNSENFLSIAVGRSWVSSRDILGFYNSLKGTYQEARTGLYQFLNKKENDFLKLILLDEANLSSIEHYWSDFLIMCDHDSEKKIYTGIPEDGKSYLEILPSVRFMATINNDSTTERLSPRLIDRVPIIRLEGNADLNFNDLADFLFDGAIPFEHLDLAFNISAEEATLNSSEKSILELILGVLVEPMGRANSINVSQRKINYIKRYCHVARELEAPFKISPMDYAVSQHILPLIEGYGPAFKERLEELESVLKNVNLTKSLHILKEIINSGDMYSDSYSFF